MKRLFHKHDHDQPCTFMVNMLHGQAEGRLKGFKRLYAMAHVLRCGPCRRFLESLEAMLKRVKETRPADPPPEVIEKLLEGDWKEESRP
ncbi:MAG: hypothetical protein HZC36_14250 [Armatimonadetes bacterium]|nr:hypothetical protein [Armatimonadota bacterium]